jgi:hypothetical protein
VTLVLPRQREIPGRITLEGEGFIPRFTIPLTSTGAGSINSTFLNINPQADGTFIVAALEDERTIGVPNLPLGYAIKSMTYGTADLTKDRLKVLMTDTAELHITLTTPDAKPVRVTGRVEGWDSTMRPVAVLPGTSTPIITLYGSAFSTTLSTGMETDGSFKFPKVYPGDYTVRFGGPLPTGGPQSTASVHVADADVTGVTLVIPRRHEISGRVVVEGGPAIARIGLRLRLSDSPVSAMAAQIIVQPDGTFRVTLPEGRGQLDVTGLPSDYSLKSLTYGDTDLRRNPLNIGSSDRVEELRIVLEKSATPAPNDRTPR